jgi:single-strand DNA-binding protein
MFNKVILVGNLTRDIELRYLQTGTAVGGTGIAVNRRFKSANGEQKDETLFIDITFFGRTAEIANQYLRKGSKVLVEGRLKLDSWEDQNGGKRSKHSVVVENMQMMDSRNTQEGGYNAPNNATQNSYQQQPAQQSYNQPPQQQSAPMQKESIPEIDIDDDEIPF